MNGLPEEEGVLPPADDADKSLEYTKITRRRVILGDYIFRYMFLVIGAFNDAFGIIINKIILSKLKLPVAIFASIQFFFLAVLAGLTVPFLGWINPEAFSPVNLMLLGVMLVLATLWNLFYYRAIQKESIETLELYLLLQPLLTVVVSALFFVSERHTQTFLAATVASITLIVTHLNRRHIQFGRYELILLLGVFLMALESIVIKLLVQSWSPAALYSARTLGVFLVMVIATRPTVKDIRLPTMILIFFSALAGVIYKTIQFTSYANDGIVFTTLILILSPVFVLLLDRMVLHERIHLKQLFAIVVIIAAALWGTVAR